MNSQIHFAADFTADLEQLATFKKLQKRMGQMQFGMQSFEATYTNDKAATEGLTPSQIRALRMGLGVGVLLAIEDAQTLLAQINGRVASMSAKTFDALWADALPGIGNQIEAAAAWIGQMDDLMEFDPEQLDPIDWPSAIVSKEMADRWNADILKVKRLFAAKDPNPNR